MKHLILSIICLIGLESCSYHKNRTEITSVNWTLVTSTDNLISDDIVLAEYDPLLPYDSTVALGMVFNYEINFYSDSTFKEGPMYHPLGADGTEQVLKQINYSSLSSQGQKKNKFLKEYKNYYIDSSILGGRIFFKSFNDYIIEFNKNAELSNANNEERNEIQVIWLGHLNHLLLNRELVDETITFDFKDKNIVGNKVSIEELLE